MFVDPKKIIMKEIAGSTRRYQESDAPGVLEKVCRLGNLDAPTGSNRSWKHLRGDVRKCCSNHVGGHGDGD
jgi:hypothetical protein